MHMDTVRRIIRNGEVYYSLADLHKISGGGRGKEPGAFKRYAIDFIQNANSRFDKNQLLTEFHDGSRMLFGTELICLRYASYINPEFELDVYQFFMRHNDVKGIIFNSAKQRFLSASRLFPDFTQRAKFVRLAQEAGWTETGELGVRVAKDKRYARDVHYAGNFWIEYNEAAAMELMSTNC